MAGAFFTPEEYAVVAAACERMIPADADPGATDAAVADYIDTLLGAFRFDPPRIWAGGPTSGRAGGEARFGEFISLSPLEELAWRIRLEGSRGIPEREFNGPAIGWQQQYRDGIAALGFDFPGLASDRQDARLASVDESFRSLLYEHACEGMYGAPEYGGNRDLVGWRYIDFAGDVQPRGYTEDEVSGV
jgi:hypothetical protein